ncbi:MAG: copper amine oxidase N-terminal domain-containing protein [Firmicutes bacterium]|nr:copper amine oxidase N-terminal domain-containing protein [Bacillota bacterium]
MKKSLITFALTTILFCLLPYTAFAGILVIVDGTPLSKEDEPAFVSEKLMVPMRSIFEILGAKVVWDNGNITAALGGTEIKLRINRLQGQLNNKPHILPVAPTIINGKTMVPLRFVSETLGADVDYLNEQQLVLITSPKYKSTPDGSDFDFKKTINKYKLYRNNTIANERAIANYKSIKATVLNHVDDIKSYDEKICTFINANDSSAVVYAINNLSDIQALQDKVKATGVILVKEPLTHVLGEQLESYVSSVSYVYNLLSKEKKITPQVEEVVQKVLSNRQKVQVTTKEIDAKIDSYIETGRAGVSQ